MCIYWRRPRWRLASQAADASTQRFAAVGAEPPHVWPSGRVHARRDDGPPSDDQPADALRSLARRRRNHRYWTTCAPFLDDLLDDLSRRIRRRDEGCGVRKSGIGNGLRRAREPPLLVDGRLGRLGQPILHFSTEGYGSFRRNAFGHRLNIWLRWPARPDFPPIIGNRFCFRRSIDRPRGEVE
jgi:hypothetical protein